MWDIAETIVKSLISVTILFLLTRLMGKRHISQLTFFDYVSGISIGSIAAAFAVDKTINYARGIAGLVIFAVFPISLSYISLKSYRGRKWLDGKSSVLIQNGKIVESNLAKTRMNIDDLLEECRLKGTFDIADIEYAILETNGNLSVQLKAPNQPLTPEDLNMKPPYNGLCANLIIDGKIVREHLSAIGKDEGWLMGELGKQGIADPHGVLLAYLDSSDTLRIHEKIPGPPPSDIL